MLQTLRDYMKQHSVRYNFYGETSEYFYKKISKMRVPAQGLHFCAKKISYFKIKLLNCLTYIGVREDELNQTLTITQLKEICFATSATMIENTDLKLKII